MQLTGKQLTGKQIAQLRDALVEAYTTDTLVIMVRFELNERLEVIAGGQNLSVLTFNLVNWAEQNGRIEELIQAAYRYNKGNPYLQQLWADSRAWPTAKAPPDPPPTAPPGPQTSSSAPSSASAPASIDIFLSYSRQDSEAMRAVQEVLRSAGFAVWTDEGLEPGAPSWVAAIQEAIEQANAFVVLLSPAAKASKWVNREIGYAEARGKPIYPLLAAGDAGSAIPISLINAQWIDGRHSLSEVIAQHLLPALAPVLVAIRVDLIHTLKVRDVISVAFSPDGSTLATSDYGGGVQLWDVQTGKVLHMLTGHHWAVTSLAFSPDGSKIASGCWIVDTVQLWDTVTCKATAAFEGHTEVPYSIAFSPDGVMLASGSVDNTVRLWDAETGDLLHTLEEKFLSPQSVVFSHDGSLLLTGGLDAAIRLWDPITGELLRTRVGHTRGVRSVAFSPDDKTIASGSDDTTIRLWDTITGEPLHTITEQAGMVKSIAFSPDGLILAGGSDDHTVRLWRVVRK